jgi:group I intron endonuclease
MNTFDLFNFSEYRKLKISCIYKLTTTYNNLFYIGSTNNFAKRMKDHRNYLKCNKHVAKYFQNVINKHGFNCVAEIVEEVEESMLLEREKYYIKLYKPRYNTILDPTSQLNNPSTSKIIYQYTLEGNYLKEWKSVNSVNRKLDIQVTPALNKINRSAGNFQWRTFKKDKIEPYKANQGVEISIYVYDIFGNFIEESTIYKIQQKYYKEVSIKEVRNKINQLCKTSKAYNKLRYSKQFFEKLDNTKNPQHKKGAIVLQYDSKMNFIDAYDSIQSAQEKLDLTSIYDNIVGKTKLVNKQYKFKLLDSPFI